MATKAKFDPVPSSLVMGKEVSRGSFGFVLSATLDKKPVAVKQFHQNLMLSGRDNVHFQKFIMECKQLKDLDHPNVVKYIGAYQGKNGPLLVMEMLHETLEAYLERHKGKLSLKRVMKICSEVCEGMLYLHRLKKPLIHRDLSSRNVLLTETGVVKIADFGQSKLIKNYKDMLESTQPGAMPYMPPEALKEETSYTAKVDSFSLGVLMFEICTQTAASCGLLRVNDEIEVKRREDDLRLLDDAHPLKPLIVWCLQYEELRPTVATIHNHICNDEKTRLEWEIKQLKMEVEDKLTDISVLKQVSEQYAADFRQERKDREDAAGRFDEKEEEWRKGSEMREKQLDQLKTSNGQLALRVADLENEVESLKKEVTESHKVEEDLRKKLSNKEQTLEKKEVTHQKKVDELNHEITKLKADLVEKRKSKRGVKTRSESLEEACTQLQSEKTEMERQLTTLVESNKMKGERNRELMQENAQLKAELRLAAATGKMEEQSKDQESRCRAQEQQIQSLQKQSKDQDSRCRAQEQQIQSLQEQSKGQDSRCRAQEQQIQSLQEQLMDQNYKHRAQQQKLIRHQEVSFKAQEQQLKALQSQLAHYPRRVVLLKENIGSVNRETTRLRGELNNAKEEIQSRSQHSARVAGELKASSEERSRLEKDLRKLQDEHQKRKD